MQTKVKKRSGTILDKTKQNLTRNVVISAIIFSGLFVSGVIIYRLFIQEPTYLYARVKMGQGLWWANTQKPSIWFTEAIRSAKPSIDIGGRVSVMVQGVRTYSWGGGNQYETYVDLQLSVSSNRKKDKYIFNRAPVAIGAPIEIELPGIEFSGTVIQLSEKPIKNALTPKTVTLTKRGEMPWEYEQIAVGDGLSNGKEEVFRVLDKATVETLNLSDDLFGNYPTETTESKRYIVVKISLNCFKGFGDKLVYAEEFALVPGKNFGLQADGFNFSDYTISRIE